MSVRPLVGLFLALELLPPGNGVAEGAAVARRCSPIGGIPANGYDPAPLVASARVILRARADSVTAGASGRATRPGPQTSVHFTVLEVIDSGGMAIPRSLRITGSLSKQADFNTKPVPYRWVRSEGLRGSCNAYSYQQGGEFLLLLQGNAVEALHPYWSGLTPTNEQVRGADDPWVLWVRAARRAAAATLRKAVFIILDGIPADVIERVATPAIDAIAAAGGYARAHVGGELGGPTETPTISAPGYMSLLTATWANKHNVRGNSKLSPNYDYWNIFRIVESVDPTRHTALFSTWLDNRTVLLGEGRPDAGNFRLDHAADGFERDTIAFPHDSGSRYILAIDERVSRDAAAYIAAKGPDLSWVYLQHTDDAAHANGDGEGFYAAVRQADAQVGRIWEAVKQRQAMGEEWMIVVTTDHGRDAPTGKGHGGQSVRERTTWIATNQSALGPRFRNGTLAIVDITPSILEHLGIAIPPAVAAQMEGVSFLRPRAR